MNTVTKKRGRAKDVPLSKENAARIVVSISSDQVLSLKLLSMFLGESERSLASRLLGEAVEKCLRKYRDGISDRLQPVLGSQETSGDGSGA